MNTGGTAFPTSNGGSPDDGMTLRDYFAAKAMRDVMLDWRESRSKDRSADYDEDLSLMARDCYAMADAMLEARKA
jgi:hypothetical protein